jgi:hypothetical protein
VGKSEKIASRTAPATAPAALKPVEVAFLGECAVRAADRRAPPLYVQALCWSRTRLGWTALTETWAAIKAQRDGTTPHVKLVKGPPPPPSWVYVAVPMLGAPFREITAEESTLAAWIARTQLAFAVAIVDDAGTARRGDALPYKSAIGQCLEGYQAFQSTPGYDPVRLVMAPAQAPSREGGLAEAFRDVRVRLRGAPVLEGLQLRTCAPGGDPLPLALATLAATAVARHVAEPGTANPIYDAVRGKLAQVPRRLAAEGNHRR